MIVTLDQRLFQHDLLALLRGLRFVFTATRAAMPCSRIQSGIQTIPANLFKSG